MSTNASITVKQNGKFYSIYLHYDGYPSHALTMLTGFYTTEEDAMELIKLGNLSVLAPSPEAPEGHSFENPELGYCIAYGRDRGETGQEAREYDMLTSVKYNEGQQYNYLFADGEWTQF